MNAVEIEEAVSELASQPFDPAEFPFQFLIAFGNKETTVRRLRKGESNASDVSGGVLQRGYIHIAVAQPGEVGIALSAMRASPKTASQKAKFILATDGDTVEAEDLVSGDVIACAYGELPRHFATFLPLAGISTVKEIKNNPIDIKATGRLNRLYVELLKDNPGWATEAKRPELNRFMARLIFCFFAEDTGIFREGQFTATIAQMSHAGHGSDEERWGNTHEVLAELFLAMDTSTQHQGQPDDRHRKAAGIKSWADVFPYVSGDLFIGSKDCPRFSRTGRAYLLRAGELDWKEINPDIFGSMIQAVADDGERGELGMHYTSVPNILKVLNPLFLDDLREQLETAGDSRQKLRNLRRRLANIRVFDPACGSGNFLVIAYKEMRAIEAEIVKRLGGESNLKLAERRSVIPLFNFYGIEIKGFAAEIARLALLIAEFQADCLYLSQQEARAMVLPLHRTGQIHVGNALRLNWLKVCPAPIGARLMENDLAGATGRLALDDSGIETASESETYICGNPPYLGSTWQSPEHKADLEAIFAERTALWKSLDYVTGWFMKAAEYGAAVKTASAFVSTNSICQGQQVPILWPLIFAIGRFINFAYTSFKWTNLASHNAGVSVAIIGLAGDEGRARTLFSANDNGELIAVRALHINAYLVAGPDLVVQKVSSPISAIPSMDFGSKPVDGGSLFLEPWERQNLPFSNEEERKFVRRVYGSDEFINDIVRYCLWIRDEDRQDAEAHPALSERFDQIARMRLASKKPRTREGAAWPFRFDERRQRGDEAIVIVPSVSSETRQYLPAGYLRRGSILTNLAFGIYNADLWSMAIVASRTHLVWIATVCGKLETRYRYSNTLGWNTFPIPRLTEHNKSDLTRCAENILLAREAHFPATIADLYSPEAMPDDLRRAHEDNDEVLERIYIGRRFRNDTERLEKLFELYTKMAADVPKAKKGRKAA